jgi:hypothetical protein
VPVLRVKNLPDVPATIVALLPVAIVFVDPVEAVTVIRPVPVFMYDHSTA